MMMMMMRQTDKCEGYFHQRGFVFLENLDILTLNMPLSLT